MANVFDTSSTGGVNFFDTHDAAQEVDVNVFDASSSGGINFFDINRNGASAPALTVDVAVNNCNIDPASIQYVDPTGSNPITTVHVRSILNHNKTDFQYRHFFWSVDGAEGKTTTWKILWLGTGNVDCGTRAAGWRPVYTTDFNTWVQSGPVSFEGNYLVFSFPGPMPAGKIYIASNMSGTQLQYDNYAAYLLSTHSGVASPLPSANASGVFHVTALEQDDLGRECGGNNRYAIKLAWGGATNDGKRKRIAVFLQGLHAAGEAQSWATYTSTIEWLINSSKPEAIALRQNFDFYLYFTINPNGTAQGNSRNTLASLIDPNRDYVGYTLPISQTLRDAMTLDTSGICDVMLDFHGDSCSANEFNAGYNIVDNTVDVQSAVVADFEANLVANFGKAHNIFTQVPNTTTAYLAQYQLNAAIAGFNENPAFGLTTRANYDDVADKWMRGLAMTDANGYLGNPYVRNQNIIYLGRTNATRKYDVPNPSNYWIPASTDFSVVMRVYSALGAGDENPHYPFSAGDVQQADSFNIFVGTPDKLLYLYFNNATPISTPSTLDEQIWYTISASRVSGSLSIKMVAEGGGSVISSSTATNTAACNFTSLSIGGRSDGNIERFWRGGIDSTFIVTGDSITDGELVDIASGNVRIPSRLAGNVIFDLPGTNDVDGKVTEQVQSAVIPLSGTGYPLEDAPLPASLVLLDATSGGVTVTGNAAELLTGELFNNAVSGAVDITGNAAELIETVEVIILDATKGAVTVSGTTGTMLSPVAYDAIKGVISIQAKPATSILQASSTTKDIVYVVGKQADLVDGVAEVFNATTAQITITEKTAEAIAVIMQALPDNVIIQGNNAELVQYAILDAISGSVNVAGLPAELREGAEPDDAIAAALRVLGVSASINDTMIIIPHRSRVLIIKGSGL